MQGIETGVTEEMQREFWKHNLNPITGWVLRRGGLVYDHEALRDISSARVNGSRAAHY